MVTAAGRRQLRTLNDPDGFLLLLVLSHPSIATVHVVQDTRDWLIDGTNYVGLGIRVTLPNDNTQAPRARIELDNVGRELVAALDSLPPTGVLRASFRQVSRARPTIIESEFSAPLSGVRVTMTTVSATVGMDDVLNAGAVRLRFDPITCPALFEG